MPPIRQEFDNLQPNDVSWNPHFKLEEDIPDDRQQAYQTAMCITTLIFDDIVESNIPDRVRRQFGAKHGIPRNPSVVSKRDNRQGEKQDWRTVNANKIAHWLSRHDCMMPEIIEDTDNGLPLEEYKVWYNLVSHPLIHNVTNSPKNILQPHIQEEEDAVHVHEPQYIMRPRGYEDQL
ncbi:hypothetical protein AMTR_s00056p00121360, partial [Amborella trichopoda]